MPQGDLPDPGSRGDGVPESSEFGRHEGLGFVKGQVIRFEGPAEGTRVLKVPQVGWNRMEPVEGSAGWSGSLLDGVAAGASMYFVHSFYVRPADRDVVLATSRYGQIDFCSALCRGSVTAFQCHPERSGPVPLGNTATKPACSDFEINP